MSQIDLKQVFLSLQDELETRLQVGRAAIRHPGTKGEASELNWLDMLSAYLPQRYCVSKAFVVDSEGQCSDQIDMARSKTNCNTLERLRCWDGKNRKAVQAIECGRAGDNYADDPRGERGA